MSRRIVLTPVHHVAGYDGFVRGPLRDLQGEAVIRFFTKPLASSECPTAVLPRIAAVEEGVVTRTVETPLHARSVCVC